jgi:hypothetical protein
MSLDDLVNITITRETAAVSRAGFGYGLILGVHMKTLNRVDWYSRSTWSTEMVADGYETTDAIYLAVQRYFAQSPCPTQVAVGRIHADRITVAIDTVQDSTLYGIGVESVTAGTPTSCEYTSDATATQTEIADGLANAINISAEAPNVTASNVADDVQIDLDGTDPMVITLTQGATLMTIGDPAGTIEDADDALNAIVLADNDWYAIAFVDRTQAQVELVAAWVESNTKLFITASADADIVDTTDAADSTTIAAVVKAAAYVRTAVMYHALAASAYPDAAWLGRCLPLDAGSITWMYKTLTGITADSLTTTQRTNALAKYCNIYETVAGVSITQEGKTGGNEYIDITRGIDWLRSEMQADIYQLLVTVDKVPYIDKGISSIESKVRAALEAGIDRKFIASITLISTPAAADVSDANKAARLLQDVEFAALLAGAIHAIEVQGVVTV